MSSSIWEMKLLDYWEPILSRLTLISDGAVIAYAYKLFCYAK